MEIATSVPKLAYRMSDLIEMFGVSKPTFYRWIKEDYFPKPAKVGRVSLWRKESIDEWWANF